MDAPHLPSASGGGLASLSPSPVSRVGAAATPCSALSASGPGGTEPSRRPLVASLRPALPRGTATPHLRPSPFLSPPSRGGFSWRIRSPEAAVAGEPMAYSQGGGKKKVCYYYDGERPGRAGAPGPEARRALRPPSRVGAGGEGWEGGGTDIWPHLNPFPTRRREWEPFGCWRPRGTPRR